MVFFRLVSLELNGAARAESLVADDGVETGSDLIKSPALVVASCWP